MTTMRPTTPTERRTGVVIAVGDNVTDDQVNNWPRILERRFPGVTFAVVRGATSSLAFEWDRPL